MSGWKRAALRFRQVFVAFTLKLPAARRAVYFVALAIAVLGLIQLFRGFAMVVVPLGLPLFHITLPLPVWADGTFLLMVSLVLVNLLVLLEVAERLSLKGELEVAREIQLALLPRGTFTSHDVEISGFTKPANTVGGDFYDVLPQPDGGIVLTLGDVAGKGSPAALLMALLLAAFRTLVEERLAPAALVARLNIQICRHSPGVALHHARLRGLQAVDRPADLRQRRPEPSAHPATGRPVRTPCRDRASRSVSSSNREYGAMETTIEPGEMLVFYSDGITEAEDPEGQPFEESGLELVIERSAEPAGVGARGPKCSRPSSRTRSAHGSRTISRFWS